MAGLYISFLGTSNYVPCCYQIKQKTSAPVRFVQEQTIRHCCKTWSEADRIVIFCTRAAKAKNWLDNGQKDGQKGLASCLEALDLKASVRCIDIPDGHTESQIWEIFALVLEQIGRKDEVIFDITHAFRSIPMLAVVILNYAKTALGIKLRHIYYGAFEALGNPQKVIAQWPDPAERVAPVLDLTAFDRLLAWSFAVDKLVKAGDATNINVLARSSVKGLIKKSKGQDTAALAVRRLADALKEFTRTMSTCRCREIEDSASKLKKALVNCREADLINPLLPLIDTIESEVAPFQSNPVTDGIQAAKWCHRHHLAQQGITILNETLITWCLLTAGKEKYINDTKMRTIASQAMSIAGIKKTKLKLKGDAKENPRDTKLLIDAISQTPGIERIAKSLKDLRNDINHGGMQADTEKPYNFAGELKKLLGDVEEMLTNDPALYMNR